MKAFIWNGGGVKEIRDFPADCSGIAYGINDQGWVVGSYVYNRHMPTADDPPPPPIAAGSHAFLFRKGRTLPLWQGIARSINNRGQTVGTQESADDDTRHDRGVLWHNGHLTLFQMQPVAINKRGEIVGNIPLTENSDKACLWRKGRITRLSHGPSYAYALNNHGQVVGEQGNQAVLWQGGRTDNLNRYVKLPKGWHLEQAIGINDKGWIIGEGSIYRSLKSRQATGTFTFLLTPR